MNFKRLIRVLKARWKIATLVFFLAACVGAFVAYQTPTTYTATAVVMIESKADPVAGVVQVLQPNFLMTQVDVIKSSRVGNKVIKSLKLEENPTLLAQFKESAAQGTYEEWLSRLLQKNLVVEPGRGSNVIRISYTSPEARFSALMANAFVAAYLDSMLEMRVEPAKRYSTFFDDRAKALREELEKAQARWSEYQKSKGIVATDDRQDIEISKLNELQTQLLQAQAQAIESSSRQSQSQQAADRTQEAMMSGLVNGIRQEIIKQESKLQELTTRLGENHPQVIETRNGITDLKSKLETEIRRVTGSVGVSNTINRQREVELRSALEAQRAKVLRLKETRDDMAVMQRDVEAAQKAYDSVQQRFNQSSLESQNQQSNISVLNQAEVPNETRTQIVMKNVAKALLAALGLALISAFVREYFDRRVRAVEDIGHAIDLQVIGVMPRPDAKGWFKRPLPSLQKSRMVRQLPFSGSR